MITTTRRTFKAVAAEARDQGYLVSQGKGFGHRFAWGHHYSAQGYRVMRVAEIQAHVEFPWTRYSNTLVHVVEIINRDLQRSTR